MNQVDFPVVQVKVDPLPRISILSFAVDGRAGIFHFPQSAFLGIHHLYSHTGRHTASEMICFYIQCEMMHADIFVRLHIWNNPAPIHY